MTSMPIPSSCAGCGGPPVAPGSYCGRCGRPGGPAAPASGPYPVPYAGPYGTPPPSGWGAPVAGPPAVPGYGGYPVTQVVVAPKSAGLAVLFTFLWLGAGHLYLNRVGPGVALLVLHFFLAVLCLTGIGALLGVPGWILAFVLASVSCSSIAAQENARILPPRPW